MFFQEKSTLKKKGKKKKEEWISLFSTWGGN
uniref:Uncharacterized protein n=1 Tax=Anguilla anguilla TaxID=7936 RepID=A0A0E9QSW3_ANGAN